MKKNHLIRTVNKWQPWDYSFNLDVEQAMFRRQAMFFEKSNIAENDKRRAEICRLLVSLIDIITGKDSKWHIVDSDIHFKKKSNNPELYEMLGSTTFADDVYINTKNINRFMNPLSVKFVLMCSTKHNLREAKAWYLYNKLRFYKMQDLWN